MMIEINLLPDELKARNKRAEQTGIPVYLVIVPALVGVMLLVHLGAGVIQGVKAWQLGTLKGKWNTLEAKRKEVEAFKQQSLSQSKDVTAIQGLLNRRIAWSQKLNRLSLDLHPGVWFTDILVNPNAFILKGSVVSLNKDEFAAINTFLSTLKSDAAFFKNFTQLELGPVKRKSMGEYEVFDFVLNGAVK
jgi:Tfp pilus assembly protein PilN